MQAYKALLLLAVLVWLYAKPSFFFAHAQTAHTAPCRDLSSPRTASQRQPLSIHRGLMSQPSAAWRRLPAAVVLETCSFLDADELGRLEMCGRQSLGDGARAWKDQMSRIHRGNLATLPPKKFLAAHARAQALYPSTADVASVQAPFRPNESVSFDEFSFTIVLAYRARPLTLQVSRSIAFQYMRLTGKQDEMGGLGLGPLMFVVSPEDRGQAGTAPFLRALAAYEDTDGMRTFFDEWGPTLTLICSRKSDGAAIKVAVFDTPSPDSWGAVDRSDEHIILGFNTGRLLIQHGRIRPGLQQDSYVCDYEMMVSVTFDQDSGRVEAFSGGVYHTEHVSDEMPNEMFYALLCARLDESMRA
jgi:hypothetical protein